MGIGPGERGRTPDCSLLDEIGRLYLVLLACVIVQIAWSATYALTSSWQVRTAFLQTVSIPLAVALPGLLKRKYWGWLVAMLASGYGLLCVVQGLVNGKLAFDVIVTGMKV